MCNIAFWLTTTRLNWKAFNSLYQGVHLKLSYYVISFIVCFHNFYYTVFHRSGPSKQHFHERPKSCDKERIQGQLWCNDHLALAPEGPIEFLCTQAVLPGFPPLSLCLSLSLSLSLCLPLTLSLYPSLSLSPSLPLFLPLSSPFSPCLSYSLSTPIPHRPTSLLPSVSLPNARGVRLVCQAHVFFVRHASLRLRKMFTF